MALNVIHTADWHIGQTFFGYDREEEHDAFLAWLLDTIEERKTDVLLISGDVFDVANPSAVAQRRFYSFLKEANRRNQHLQIVVVAGNHDSAARLEAPTPLLEELNTSIVGVVQHTDLCKVDFDKLLIPLYNKEGEQEATCLAVPYLRQGDYPASEEAKDSYMEGVARMYRQLYDYADSRRSQGEALVAMGHLHATGAEFSDNDRSERAIMGGLESVSVDTFDKGLVYTALGHLHKAQRVGGREDVRYAGSPLPMSFSEKNYRHQVVSFIIENSRMTGLELLNIPLHTQLMRVPSEPLPSADVIAQLATLPLANKGNQEQNKWPYLEVRVLFTEPNPTFRHSVEEVLADKAVRLTSIIPFYTKKKEDEEGEEDDFRPMTYTDLQNISPLEMLRHTFSSRFAEDLPEEMEKMFNDVLREIE